MKKKKQPALEPVRYWECGDVPMPPKMNKLYEKLIEFQIDAQVDIETYIDGVRRFVDDNVRDALKDYCQNATLHIFCGLPDEICLWVHCDEDNKKFDIKRMFSLRDTAMEVAEDAWSEGDRNDIVLLAEHFETVARELRERYKETELSHIKVTRRGKLQLVKVQKQS